MAILGPLGTPLLGGTPLLELLWRPIHPLGLGGVHPRSHDALRFIAFPFA